MPTLWFWATTTICAKFLACGPFSKSEVFLALISEWASPFWVDTCQTHSIIQLFSQCGPQNSSISISREFIWNANYQALPQTYRIRNSREKTQKFVLTGPPGDSDATQVWKPQWYKKCVHKFSFIPCSQLGSQSRTRQDSSGKPSWLPPLD